jgi:hypothetical protein
VLLRRQHGPSDIGRLAIDIFRHPALALCNPRSETDPDLHKSTED